MAKRIFKVIGIVLASIVGFIGAVVGVLAIMGKFKKPVVYPKQLVFADQEMMIVDDNEYEDNLSKKIFSFDKLFAIRYPIIASKGNDANTSSISLEIAGSVNINCFKSNLSFFSISINECFSSFLF